MTTLTIRIQPQLKKKAARKAEALGLPLTFVVTNALQQFLRQDQFIIGPAEDVALSPKMQAKVEQAIKILSK